MLARITNRRTRVRSTRLVCLGLALGCPLFFGIIAKASATTINLACLIRAEPGNDFLRLEAVVNAEKMASGHYRFSVSKQSESGTSQNLQSGSFTVAANTHRILTTVVLDRSAVGHYQANLSIESDLGRVSCSSP